MCAYNAIDGQPACANTYLLSDTLRKTWGFKGYVTSDCGAVGDIAEGHKFAPDIEHASADAVRAGTDTSCGDEYASLTKAVRDGLISEEEIDRSVKRLFTARFELGLFDPASKVVYARIPFSEDDSVAHRELARVVAEKSMVLLKNDGILPLKKNVKTIAVIGPNAAALAAIEGNYNAIPSHPILPLGGMEAKFGGRAKVLYAQGSPYVSELPVPVPRTLLHPVKGSAAFGLKGEYFDNIELTGKPVVTRVDQQVDFDWNAAAPVPEVKASTFGVRWTGTVTPPVPGKYEFSFRGEAKTACVFLDGKQVMAEQAQSKKHSRRAGPFALDLSDGRPHDLRIEYSHHAQLFDAGLSFEWTPPVAAERAEAVKVAEQADVVVAFVGLSPNLEGEEMPVHVEGFDGGDRSEIELPAVQKEMLEAVAATGKPVIVVLMNGSALAVKWAKENAAAVLEAWYPGEEGGAAIADTLAGDNNPAGRLPITFYAGTKELPPFDDYSMAKRTYRYFTGTTLWGFGYGLSYSKFKWSDVKLSTEKLTAGEPLTLDAEVQNTGVAKGDAVSEIYLKAPASATAPIHSLVGFVRTPLEGHARRHVHVVIDPRNLSTVATDGTRSIEAGDYSIFVGGAQPEVDEGGVTKQFTIVGTKELPR